MAGGLADGLADGLAEGLAEGMADGLPEGMADGLADGIVRLARVLLLVLASGALFSGGLLPGGALAQGDPPAAAPDPSQGIAPGDDGLQGGADDDMADPLACIANGQSYAPGEIACVPGCHGRQRLARCDMAGASVGWTTVANDCPTAAVTPIPLAGKAAELVCLPDVVGRFALEL
jgi:hypothetical protein